MTSLLERMTVGPVVLDGGLATQLERQGYDISDDLWSARLLRDDPEAIVQAHREFFRAGAEVATSASYQASFDGFAAHGIDRADAVQLMRLSVELARKAADEVSDRQSWVAASVGPYGATLADGSEYRGDYGLSVSALREFHRSRLQVLAESGADVLAIETIPCAAEVEAVLLEVQELDVPAWLALTIDGTTTRAGEPLADVYAMAADVDAVIAVGVNCSRPNDVPDALRAARLATGKPGIAYPNSGEAWDAEQRRWEGDPRFDPTTVRLWAADGAALIGGCCRVGPNQISDIAASL